MSQQQQSRVGDQVSQYKLVRLLGHGGFADVYLGEHIYLKTEAAIKLLHHNSTAHLRSFREEAKIIAGFDHPNIVRLLEFTPAYIIMEYAPGGTLRDLVKSQQKLDLQLIVQCIAAIAKALQYAHDHHVIHQDVKPENILIKNDRLLLSDFGIAITRSEHLPGDLQGFQGTYPYAAPEQCLGNPCPASDQYALGIVAYELLTGRVPFTGNGRQVMYCQVHEAPPSIRQLAPDVPLAIEEVIMRALAKDLADRYPKIQGFADALTRAFNQAQSVDTTLVKARGPLPRTREPLTVTRGPLPAETQAQERTVAQTQVSVLIARRQQRRTADTTGGKMKQEPKRKQVTFGERISKDWLWSLTELFFYTVLAVLMEFLAFGSIIENAIYASDPAEFAGYSVICGFFLFMAYGVIMGKAEPTGKLEWIPKRVRMRARLVILFVFIIPMAFVTPGLVVLLAYLKGGGWVEEVVLAILCFFWGYCMFFFMYVPCTEILTLKKENR